MKPEKLNSGMNGILTHELCDADAVFSTKTAAGSWLFLEFIKDLEI